MISANRSAAGLARVRWQSRARSRWLAQSHSGGWRSVDTQIVTTRQRAPKSATRTTHGRKLTKSTPLLHPQVSTVRSHHRSGGRLHADRHAEGKRSQGPGDQHDFGITEAPLRETGDQES